MSTFSINRRQMLAGLAGATALPGLAEAVTPEGDVRTLPSLWAEHGGIDGFFAARLTRL